MSCVYEIRCIQNNFRYVGQTRNLSRRVAEHNYSLKNNKHSNKRLQADYNKYGNHAFILSVLCVTSDHLDEEERIAIEKYRAKKICYNVFSGGTSGYKGDDEFREKMSLVCTGRKLSDKEKSLRAESTRRQWENPEYREKMRQSAKRQWNDKEYREMMLAIHTSGANVSGHILTKEVVADARCRYKHGEKISDLAKECGVAYCTMRNALAGTTWKHIS